MHPPVPALTPPRRAPSAPRQSDSPRDSARRRRKVRHLAPSCRAITPLLRSVLYVVLVLCTCTAATAQEFGRMNEQVASGTAYRIFARPGDATVQVVVVAAEGSGVYEVASDTDLGALVALTGGLEAAQRGGDGRVTVRLLRKDGGARRTIYEAPLEQLLLEPGRQPTLLDGDVLTVDRIVRQRFHWRDALSITTAVATLSWTLRSLLSGS